VGSGDVLMVQRFDHEHTDQGYLRFGLVSGLTVLDCGDSHLNRERWSYPLLADNLRAGRTSRTPIAGSCSGAWSSTRL
jgi:serine/threonine-protein kinase HipA